MAIAKSVLDGNMQLHASRIVGTNKKQQSTEKREMAESWMLSLVPKKKKKKTIYLATALCCML